MVLFLGVFLGEQSKAQGGSDEFFKEELEVNDGYQPKEGGCKDLVIDYQKDDDFFEEEDLFNKSEKKEENINNAKIKRHFGEGEKKEEKKEEMSTLSFNLFLYIVDRFKEE